MADNDNIDPLNSVAKPCTSWIEEVFKDNDSKPVCLSLQQIVKRHLPSESAQGSHDEIIREINKIRRVRLDRENIGQIDSLELLNANVTHLYLQFNKITKIENLECLPNLQVLILSDNMITTIENIGHLQKLIFFDISNNQIEEIEAETFPGSIIILNLSKNPCVNQLNYRSNVIKWFPKLKHLDGKKITNKQEVEAGSLKEFNAMEKEVKDSIDEDNDNAGTVAENILSHGKCNVDLREPKKLMGYKQLPQIPTNIHDLATNMLLRSQTRMEERTKEYRKHVQEITNIKILTKIKPENKFMKPEGPPN